jgi:WD40 repeat protein
MKKTPDLIHKQPCLCLTGTRQRPIFFGQEGRRMQNETQVVDEVFISYSRKDKAFVTRLHDTLKSKGRKPWVDWEMEPLERWEQSIRHAIDRAIAVIVVLSPDWLASRECAKELQRATEQHKRLLPVLHQKVDDGLVDGTVKSINWINFLDDRDFDAAIDLLLKGLDEDPEWKRRLAQLLTQAVRWDDSGRDVSQTLRGRGLEDAEQLMGAAAQNTPKPTELQAHYVLESRRAVARRQRLTLGAIAFGLLVAVSLSIVAYFQSKEKSRQERISSARQLVNQAEALRNLPGKPEGLMDSVRIGVQALAATAALQVETASADESVRRGLDLLPELPTELPSGTHESRAVMFEPFGRYLAVGYQRGRIGLWDLVERREHTNGRRELQGMDIRGVDVTPDGQYMAATAYDAMGGTSRVIVWRLSQPEEVATFSVPGDLIDHRVGLSPDGAHVYLSGLRRTEGWNVALRTALNPFPPNTMPSAMAFSPDGGRLALAYRMKDTRDRVVEVLDAKTLSSQARWFESGLMHDVRWTASGEQLVVVGHDFLFMRDAKNGALRYAYSRGGPRFAASARGQLIAEASPGYEITVRDGESKDVYRRLIHSSEVKGLAFGPDDRSIVTFAVDGKIRVWKLGHGSAFEELYHTDSIVNLWFAGDTLITQSKSQSRGWRLPRPGEKPVALVEHDQSHVTPPPDTRVRLSARISEDGKQVALVGQKGEAVRPLDFSETVGAAVVSESGRRLGILLSQDTRTRRLGVRPTIELWDIESMTRLNSVTPGDEVSRSDFKYLSFDHDDRFLVTKTEDGFRVWDANTLTPLYSVFHGDPERIAFQPKGPLAATAAGDQTVRVWRVEGKALTEMARLRSRSKLKQMLLDGQGWWVAAVTEDGRALLWAVQPDELIAQACARIAPPCGPHTRATGSSASATGQK